MMWIFGKCRKPEAGPVRQEAADWRLELGARGAPLTTLRSLRSPLIPLHAQRSTLGRRSAFSLVELLVVITIISILIAASGAIVANFLKRAKESATATMVQKIHGLIQQRKEAVDRHFQFGEFRTQLTDYRGVLQKKNALRGALPQRIEDLFGLDGAPGRKNINAINNSNPDLGKLGEPGSDDPPTAVAFREALREAGYINNKAFDPSFYARHDRVTESAELLYVVLTRAEVFGIPPVDTDSFATSEVADTDGDGLLEFVDAWGHPLRFYRWPTRLLRPFGLYGRDNEPGVAGTDDDGNGQVDALSSDLITPDQQEIAYLDPTSASYSDPDEAPRRDVAGLLIAGLPALAAPDPLNDDPDDPVDSLIGLLRTYANRLTEEPYYLSKDQARQRAPFAAESNWHTLFTYHVPLVVSAGADGELGLYEPYFLEDRNYNGLLDPGEDQNGDQRLNYGTLAEPLPETLADPGNSALADNITNRNQRAGGR